MTVLRRAAATIVAAALTLIAAPPAFSAAGVYGGTTSAREAIVLTTDAAGKRLRSAVVAWEAECTDGMRFPIAVKLTAVDADPGFQPRYGDLTMSRNAKGRFAGTQLAGLSDGSNSAVVSARLSGRLGGSRASGDLSATVTVIDDTTGEELTTCDTGRQTWSATRSRGRVFGGSTSQEEPIVIRLDRKRKTVTDVLTGWQSSSCQPPDRYFRFPFGFSRLRVRSGRFAVSYEEPVALDDGGSLKYTYDVSGSLSRRSARGDLRVTVAGTDPAGTANLGCDSGEVSWRAATG